MERRENYQRKAIENIYLGASKAQSYDISGGSRQQSNLQNNQYSVPPPHPNSRHNYLSDRLSANNVGSLPNLQSNGLSPSLGGRAPPMLNQQNVLDRLKKSYDRVNPSSNYHYNQPSQQ
jgi:hypothetical protein